MKTDLCIIGAGPAGIFASVFSAQSRANTVIIERNTTPCRKLLLTGGGRCNLTHTGSIQDFVKSYGQFGRFLRHCLYQFSPDDLRRYFAKQGLDTKAQKDGCVFPASARAADVADVLLNNAKNLAVKFLYNKKAKAIEKTLHGFKIITDSETISADAAIIATGGLTWPSTGSKGDGFTFARNLGHNIIEPKPSLASLLTAETWTRPLEGVAVQNVIIKTKIKNRKIKISGPLMFTDTGITGPAVLDLSWFITDYLPAPNNPLEITIDLLPQHSIDQLDEQIISLCSKHPKKTIPALLNTWLPKSLIAHLCSRLNTAQPPLAGTLKKSARKHLITLLRQLPLSIIAAGPIEDATVTRGGVSTDEINPKTMESKICPRLFFAGEVINADGPCGGYNLQIAFSTGALAGKMAAKTLTTPPQPL